MITISRTFKPLHSLKKGPLVWAERGTNGADKVISETLFPGVGYPDIAYILSAHPVLSYTFALN